MPIYGYTRGEFSSGLFLQAFLVVVVLGIVGGLYPAWRASKLQPLEAMRYDGAGHSRAGSRFNLNFGGMTFKSVFRRKTRTALTLVAIGIGIGAIVGLGGMIDGVVGQLDTIF